MPLIRMTGVFGIPLALLTVTIAALVVRAALSVRRGQPSTAPFALLFWGFAAAVLGFLGQCIGLYNGLTAVSHASDIDPRIVSRGLAESFSTTIWGGALLVLAGAAWLVLRAVAGRVAVRTGGTP
jgi:hypothetical protein